MKKPILFTILFTLLLISAVDAGKSDCTNLNGQGFEPIRKVNTESFNVVNDYDTVIAEQSGVVYLSLVGGSQPIPNACGLNPKNARLN